MTKVEYFFDLTCPWSYLALLRLHDATDRNAAGITFKPVSINDVLATENPALLASRLAENPAKAAWQKDDLSVWAAMWGVTLNLPDKWPLDGKLAGAGMVVAEQAGKGMEFAMSVFAAGFGENADIDDAELLTRKAEEIGLAGAAFAANLIEPASAAVVEKNTHELIRRGGFGTPSMFVGDELFFGNDRVPLVEWALGPVRNAGFVMPGQHNVY